MRACWGIMTVAAAIACACPPAGANDGPTGDNAALDKQLYDALKDMHNRAADLYNQGDANGCYRMFQGGMLMARPLLTYRPDVQKILDEGLLEADRQPSIAQRAVKLHKTIETMREKLKPGAAVKPVPGAPNTSMPASPGSVVPTPSGGPTPPGKATDPAGGPAIPMAPAGTPATGTNPPAGGDAKPTLWTRLGGEAKIEKAIDYFVTNIVVDMKVNLSRGGKFTFDQKAIDELKYKLLCYVSKLSDGSLEYKGKTMADAHKAMNITGAEFDELVKWLRTAFDVQKSDAAAVNELVKKIQESRKDIVSDK